MDQSVPLWAAILLPFAGYFAAAATEYLRGRQTLVREREARADARLAARQDARDEFQRTTLLELQDAMAALMRNTARIHHESEMEFKRLGTWGRQLLDEEIGGEPSIQLVRDFQRLRVRVLDDALREGLKQWSAHCTRQVGAMRGEDDEEARQRETQEWSLSITLYEELAESIGKRLRILIAHWDDQ